MKIRFGMVCCLAMSLMCWVGTAPAHANRPDRSFWPNFDGTLPSELACGTGDVQIHIDTNNEYANTFYDRDGNVVRIRITGSLKETFTNLENGKSVSLNVSGPLTLNFVESGLDFVSSGNGVWFNFSNLPNQILYTSGGITGTVDFASNTLTFLSGPGRVENICPQLS